MRKFLVAVLLCCVSAGVDAYELKNKSELSLLATGGNSRMEAVGLLHDSKLVQEANAHRVKGEYLLAVTQGTKTTEKWYGLYRYERELLNGLLVWAENRHEGDEFSQYTYRMKAALGPRFVHRFSDELIAGAEVGYLFMYDHGYGYKHFGQAAFDAGYTISEMCSLEGRAEALKKFDSKNDFIGTVEAALIVMATDILSLKLGGAVKYDNTTPAKNYDYTIKTALMASY